MSGRERHHRVRAPQQQGQGRSERRNSQGGEERQGKSASGGHSQNRRGGHRSQSHGRDAEASGRPPRRQDQSAGQAPFPRRTPHDGHHLSAVPMTQYLARGFPQHPERGRLDRPASPFGGNNSRRGNWHSSQGRIPNHALHTTADSAAGAQRPPPNHRPQIRIPSHNTRRNERGSQGQQLSLSQRSQSQPDLLQLGGSAQEYHRRAPRNRQESHDPKPKPSQRLDFRSLEKILEMEPSEVVMKLAAPGSGLQEFLDRKDTTDNLTSITLDVLSKACSSRTNRQNLQHLLAVVKDSHFLKGTIPMFVMMLGTGADQEKRKQNLARLKQITDLYVTLMSVFPSSTVIDVSLAMFLLEQEFANLQSAGIGSVEETEESLGKLRRMVAHLQEKKREGTLRSDAYAFLLGTEDESDVESFRRMSVFPTYEDVHATERPFLRPNIIGERFKDSDTYLDTHFRLLREDFVKPLRDGISHLLHFEGKDLHRGRFDDIRIYFNARILAPVCTPKGILYRVEFDNKNLKLVNWESSKRLLYGALVCLSADSFETMIFATVANRDVKELKDGVTTLFFTEENRMKLAEVSSSDAFLMVETTAFFEAYRHVLEGLQEMRAEDLPMQRYIVSCDDDISPPSYLLAHRHQYSLQALMNDRSLKIEDTSVRKRRSLFDILTENTKDRETVGDILNLDDWPSKEQLKLDDSQMKAVQLALTKEIAIIQGPPGTGKTFVGLKIVKALLDNAQVWQSGTGCPILVVCYTNHALDQFLEGILKFMRRSSALVRVGGRSSSEALKELSLNSRRRETNFRQNLAGHLRAMFAQLSDDRKDMEKNIGKMAAILESSAKGILHEKVLDKYILSVHGTTLEETLPGGMGGFHRKKVRSLMMDWLGVSMLSHASRQMEITVDIKEEEREERMSVASGGLTEADFEELNPFAPYTAGYDDFGDVDLYQSEDEEAESNSGEHDEHASSEGDNDSTSTDDITKATEVLSLAESQDEDSASEVASVTTDGEVALADLLQVAEEAELVQAERMMEGDDMRSHILSARRRLAQVQRVVLAYVPELEEEEEGRGARKEESDDEGWEITRDMKKKLKHVVKQELQKTDHMLEEDAEQFSDLWALPYKQRWRLYRLWLSKYRSDMRTTMLEHENRYQAIVNRIEELRNIEDKTILQKASVIGMTTTCAARYRRVLQDIQPRIVVVEEAAEVLESHIITTLTPACQHLILIGDHQQLRPSATVYELARNFNLEVSLFERLIRMDVPYVRLDYQHRMRPEIARLLTPHIYDRLENHTSVSRYENIKGVMQNIFFVDHKHLEESIHEGRSHQNMHEAAFVKALCYYLMCQGYKPSQITVLTTYTGQLFCLKKLMPKSMFEGVNLCVVDRYQGEENDIVILSLVRSNKEGKVGFLKIPNRVCVALSRAKKGLFCIGNMSMLSTVPLWAKINGVLSNHGQIGEAVMLRCENHPDTVTAASSPEDFLKAPLGGCTLPCEFRLDCGHVCTLLCHPKDPEHKDFKCQKPCAKTLCENGHRCPKMCSAECGDCRVPVTKTLPRCGHEQEVPCSTAADDFLCRVPCNKTLPCGHLCVRACGETCTRNCPQKMTVDLDCGHQRVMLCHVKQEADKNKEKIRCWKKCGADLDCGHACSGTCFDCAGGAAHVPCGSACGIPLVCGHQCQGRCGRPCMPCPKPCENQCYHKKCPGLCSDACPPCANPCGWRCKHHKCDRLCHEPCDRPPCSHPCPKTMKCSHKCIGMCGEPCPKKCRVCHADEVQEIFFGSEADPKAQFVKLTDCGHMFEVSGFDAWMESPPVNGAIGHKACPKCQTPIRRSVRYNNAIKRTRADIEVAKRKVVLMWAEQVRNSVKEREAKGIRSPHISPLLSKLSASDCDVKKLMSLTKQIELFSTLAEIKRNAETAMPLHRLRQIRDAADQCSANIAAEDCERWPATKYQIEVKRLRCLAEALVLLEDYTKSRSSKILTFFSHHPKLSNVIRELEDMQLSLNEQNMQNIQKILADAAEAMKPSTRWQMVEESNGFVVDSDFLKLKHWSKCGKGHINFRQDADTDTTAEWCLECSNE